MRKGRILLAGLILLSPMTVIADLILEVNVDDSANVTFTATTNNSATDSTLASNILGGFTVADFFTSVAASIATNTAITGDLAAAQGSGTYERIGTFDFSANDGLFTAGDDISVYSSSVISQVFTAGQQAFSGTATMDFSALSSFLPSLGTSGNLYTGFLQSGRNDHGELIGTWRVVSRVPEPSTLALLGAALAGLGFARRRKAA